MAPKPDPVRSLAFVSTTTREFDDQELEQLFVQMSDFNRPHGIGGVLLYSQCNVVQCIEGRSEAIGLAFDRIRRSTRHKDVMVLTDQLVSRRSFSKWKVGLAYAGWTACSGTRFMLPILILKILGLESADGLQALPLGTLS